MKILFLSGLYPPNVKGGAELSTHLIARGLKALGHDISVITAGNKRDQKTVDDIPVLQLPLKLTAKPLFERRHSNKIAAALAEELKNKDYDIIHAHDFRSAQAISELDCKNIIVTARDYAQICGSPNNLLADGSRCPGCGQLKNVLRNRSVVEAPLWRKPFRVWQYRYNIGYRLSSFRKFRNQIFISHAQQSEIALMQNLDDVRTNVIYNPIDPMYLKKQPEHAREQNILFVGTVESYKGVGLLLDAFAVLLKKHSNINLKIVGDGAQLDKYKQWVERYGLQYRVAFTGRVSQDRLMRLYDEAMMLVAPHIWVEPFGRTVVEAMARGKVVVTSNMGGPAKVVQDGKTGFLFNAGSKDALVATMNSVLNMGEIDKREVGKAAREWVSNNLTIERIAKQHEDVYAKMLDNLSSTNSGVIANIDE